MHDEKLACSAAALTWARFASKAAAASALLSFQPCSGCSSGSQAMNAAEFTKESGCRQARTCSHIRLDTCKQAVFLQESCYALQFTTRHAR